MYCGKCGKQINSSFCPYCGTKNDNLNDINNNLNNNNNNVSTPSLTPKKKISVGFLCGMLLVLSIAFLSIGFVLYRNNRTRTVMIYMVGANLESKNGFATNELNSINFNKTNSNKVKIVLMAGGSKAWHNDYIDVSETSIYELKENGFVKVDKRSRTNMGTYENLSYFLNYVSKNYKSNIYDFIFWDHGGAVEGSEYDELSGKDPVDLMEMNKAFSSSKFKGFHKLEVLGFRTCLNSTVEIANIYKKYAKYLVASEEITWGSTESSPLLFLNDIKPNDDGKKFGIKQVESYKKALTITCNHGSGTSKEENYCKNSTYSVIDLSKMNDINKALDDFASDLNNNLSSKYADMIKIRANMKQYVSDDDPSDMIDLYDLADKFKNYSPAGETLKKAIEKSVVYNWTNNNYSNGLSIYFPYNQKLYLSFYSIINNSSNYNSFINNFVSKKEGSRTKSFSSLSSNEVKVENVTKDSADIEVELTDEQAKNVSKVIYYVLVEGDDGLYRMIFSGRDYDLEGNKLKARVKGKMARIVDKDYADINYWAPAVEKESADNYTDVEVLATLRNTGFNKWKNVHLDVRLTDNNKKGKIMGVYDYGNDDNQEKYFAPSPLSLKLSDYYFIQVLSGRGYKLFGADGQYNPTWFNNQSGAILGSYFRTDSFKIEKEDFSSNYNYYAVFAIRDLANYVYFSKPVKIGWE